MVGRERSNYSPWIGDDICDRACAWRELSPYIRAELLTVQATDSAGYSHLMKRDYIEFNERSTAKGYLITFRCYGTWLHGDERGSVDRRYFNAYGAQKIKPDAEKEKTKSRLMRHEAFILGARERSIVEAAIKEVCLLRGYILLALNIRTNHIHLVVYSASGNPERIMNSFKAYSTRALRSAGLVNSERKLWSRHGSTRYLWTEEHVATAVDYVLNGQGDELPKFE